LPVKLTFAARRLFSHRFHENRCPLYNSKSGLTIFRGKHALAARAIMPQYLARALQIIIRVAANSGGLNSECYC
jgi:hypothetical protein